MIVLCMISISINVW